MKVFLNNFIKMEKPFAKNKTFESQESCNSASATKRTTLSLTKKVKTPKNKGQKSFQKITQNEKVLKFRKDKKINLKKKKVEIKNEQICQKLLSSKTLNFENKKSTKNDSEVFMKFSIGAKVNLNPENYDKKSRRDSKGLKNKIVKEYDQMIFFQNFGKTKQLNHYKNQCQLMEQQLINTVEIVRQLRQQIQCMNKKNEKKKEIKRISMKSESQIEQLSKSDNILERKFLKNFSSRIN